MTLARTLTAALLACTFSLSAQLGSTPPGWHMQYDPAPYVLETFDHLRLLQEDTKIEDEGGRTNHGRLITYSATVENAGEWHVLPNGDQVWRLRLTSQGALGMAAFFENYHMPVGAALYIYDTNRTWSEGPYDYTENNTHGIMTTAEVPGDDVIIEVYMPADAVGKPTLGIRGVGHFYRHMHFDYTEARRGSDPCEVDVNCPEGAEWEPLRDSVVRLRIVDGAFIGLCSGVLVNTVVQDCRLYLLTALHCAEGISDDDFLSLQVRFNFERTGCGTGAGPSSRNRNGVFHLADSNDGGGNSGSDFLLVEIEDEIPGTWNPFFAGWDASGSGSGTGVCVHHPAGDYKKISTYTDPLSAVWFGAPGSHWEVEWVETETNHGVTEGGSSGSPIFNDEGLVLGTLTGGSSYCDAPNDPDYYGRMSHHWDSNPNSAAEKLKEWLDPDGTGTEVMFGGYAPNCDQDVLEVTEFTYYDIQLFPNPATDQLQIAVSSAHDVASVNVSDVQGRLVDTITLSSSTSVVDLSGFGPGIYYFTFTTGQNQQVTKKVVVQ